MPATTIPASTTFGEVSGFSSGYASARSNASDESTGGQQRTVGQNYGNSLYFCYQSFLRFSLGAFEPSWLITRVRLQLVALVLGGGAAFDVQVVPFTWTAPISSGNRQAAYGGALAAAHDVVWNNSGSMALNTPHIGPDMDTARVQAAIGGFVYYALRSNRHKNGNTPSNNEAFQFASPSYDPEPDWRPSLLVDHIVGGRRAQTTLVAI